MVGEFELDRFHLPVPPVPVVGSPVVGLAEIPEAPHKVGPLVGGVLPSIVRSPIGETDRTGRVGCGDPMQLSHQPQWVSDVLEYVREVKVRYRPLLERKWGVTARIQIRHHLHPRKRLPVQIHPPFHRVSSTTKVQFHTRIEPIDTISSDPTHTCAPNPSMQQIPTSHIDFRTFAPLWRKILSLLGLPPLSSEEKDKRGAPQYRTPCVVCRVREAKKQMAYLHISRDHGTSLFCYWCRVRGRGAKGVFSLVEVFQILSSDWEKLVAGCFLLEEGEENLSFIEKMLEGIRWTPLPPIPSKTKPVDPKPIKPVESKPINREREDLKRDTWMAVAEKIRGLSTCLRAQVGCVLVRRNGVVAATGYNGAPKGLPHCTKKTCLDVGRCYVSQHAEQNALAFCEGPIHTAYTTHEPCVMCTRGLIQRGVRKVFYLYRKDGTPEQNFARASMILASQIMWVQLTPAGEGYRIGIDPIDLTHPLPQTVNLEGGFVAKRFSHTLYRVYLGMEEFVLPAHIVLHLQTDSVQNDLEGQSCEDWIRLLTPATDPIPFGEIYRAYRVWCEKNQIVPSSVPAFSQKLTLAGFPSVRGTGGSRLRKLHLPA